MRQRYERWMYEWETRLTTRDTNRVVRPFEWGMEWAHRWPGVNGNCPHEEAQFEAFLAELNGQLVADSDTFYSYAPRTDFRLERLPVERHATGNSQRQDNPEAGKTAEFLRFTSAVETPYPENNRVNARWFPAPGRRAVVLLPQWNADALSQNVLCRVFNRLGIAALRMSMPYHDVRRPSSLERADYAVSANVCRTVDAARQAIIDLRCCLDWLETQGYDRLGMVGTSLGSCYGFLAAAHDPRLRVNVFNHASTYFGDVVWAGQSTRHVREGLEPHLDLDRLRQLWLAISPMAYFDKYARWPKRSRVIYARYDLTFPLEFSRQVVAEFQRRQLDADFRVLPCGHYTTGETPYKFMDGYWISSYLARNL